jgi:hypothetical protein
MLDRKAEYYQQLLTKKPELHAAMLNAGKNRAAESRKKKKKKKKQGTACPGSVHARSFAAVHGVQFDLVPQQVGLVRRSGAGAGPPCTGGQGCGSAVIK